MPGPAADVTRLAAATKRLFEDLSDESVEASAAWTVAPSTMEEAALVLRAAADARMPTRFYGGGTHMDYGYRGDFELVVTTSRLNRVVDWQPEDLTVVVEAGVPISTLEETIGERNQTAVLPEAFGRATVGGVVAAGLSGYRRFRYGPTRDRVLQVGLAAGYGRVIAGGGPVVKSSTGYGVPRLATGSFGSLGLVGWVMLKLWSRPRATASIQIDEAAAAASTYRPLAVLETSEGSFLYLGGDPQQVTAEIASVDGEVRSGLHWPIPISNRIRLEFRVPPRLLRQAIDWAQRVDAARWIAEHGVGRVEAGVDAIEPKAIQAARAWAETNGGALIVASTHDPEIDPWGTPPVSIEIQRRIKQAFDPFSICNPGIFPGGL
ncbi:MAG: FAD-binding protein [Acidimicrobiia bacterium]|nr:FAD-binding protein [Acidimicrobiia bacterium]